MFPVSTEYINCPCGLHLDEYQEVNADTGKRGYYNSNGKFTKCNTREHLTRSEYNTIIPKIINEFINAGFNETIEYFTPKGYTKYYETLQLDKTDIDSITSQKTKKGNGFIRCYMPHIYETSDHNNKDLKSQWTELNIQHAFKLLDKPNYTVNSYLSELLKRIKFNPVTIYPPIMTKCILERYGCKKVFDPCIGWGGRMLGTTCIGGQYTGFEPYTKTFQGLEKMITDLNLQESVNIFNDPVERVLNKLKDREFDACITSPPYYNLEVYTDESTQSIKQYKSYEEWINKFIYPIIEYVCSHVTKISCWSVKNIKTDSIYNLLDDVIKIHADFGWELIGNHSIKKNVNAGTIDGDITYIFQKFDF